MRKKIFIFVMIGSLLLNICSCSGQGDKAAETKKDAGPEETKETMDVSCPDLSQIRSICELATLECYYHNVAKSVKEKGEGLSHIGEKDRIFWIEYSGVAKFGINIAKVDMKMDGTELTITIPRAELLGLSEYSFTEDSYISSDDGINKNPITAKNQTEAIAAAEADIETIFARDDAMLMRAEENAKKLIENYVKQLGQIAEVEYRIAWVYEGGEEEK